MSKSDQLYVVTAFRTDDGTLAYLKADRTWSASLQDAKVVTDDEKDTLIEEKSALPEQPVVCDPYAFKVEVQEGSIQPLSARERIRAAGVPTFRIRRPD